MVEFKREWECVSGVDMYNARLDASTMGKLQCTPYIDTCTYIEL